MKLGIIGTGFIVHTFINAAMQHKEIQLQAIYSRSKEKAEEMAKTFNIASIYTDLDQMLQDPNIEFMYIASPNALHYEQTKLALQANKHVICEKPFTSTPKELEELIVLAKEKQLFLFEAITTLHLPNYHKVRELLPKIGDIKMVQCNFSQYSSRYDAFLRGENPNVFNPVMSGGALMDLNIYNLHFVMGLFNAPNNVQYFANIKDGIDTSGIAILEYPDFIVSCVAAKDSASVNLTQIQGEKGYITILGSSVCKTIDFISLDGSKETYNLQTVENHLYYELADFLSHYSNHNLSACYKLLDHSLLVLNTLTTLRHQAGIVFPADNK